MLKTNIIAYSLCISLFAQTVIHAIDPKVKALCSLGFGAAAMTAAKTMEKNPWVQKISSKTGLDPLDVAGVVGISAGCLTLSCLTKEELAPVFTKYAFRAPVAGALGFLVTSDTFMNIIINTPLIGEFLARKEKKYTLYDEKGRAVDMNRCKLIDENGNIEKISGNHYNSNYRCRATIVSTALYFAVDAGINALVKKYPALKFLNGE